MSPLLQLLVTAFALAVLAAWTSSLLVHLFSRWISRYRFRLSSSFWFAAAMAPALFGTIVASLTVGSGWFSSRNWIPDHCLEHGGHPHLCLSHIGNSPPGALFWLVVAIGAISIAYAGISVRVVNWGPFPKGRNGPADRNGFLICPSRVPAAFTAGFLFPRPYLTSQAASRLSVEEKGLILAHEREHVRRRDPLRLLILQFMERWLPGIRCVRLRWQATAELDCDRAAIRQGFPAEMVAETILKMKRFTQGHSQSVGLLNYAGEQSADLLKLRVEALFMNHPESSIGVIPVLVFLALPSFLALIFLMEVHHVLETVLGWLY